jgi:Ca2+-binding EF-hand superfamily protein
MRKALFAAAGLAALAGLAGFAVAQDGGAQPQREHHGMLGFDANNDGTLTRAEFDAGRQASFQRLDANNDGQLTREERRAERMHRGGRGRHGGGFQLARADANNDGNITREEFLARPTEMFDRMDANHDGVIAAAERPQRPERGERAEGERGGPRGERFNPDTNNDQQLSQAEYAAAGAQMFDRMDGNDDGRVTREEVQAMRPHRGGR